MAIAELDTPAEDHAVVREELGDFTTDKSVIRISLIAFLIGGLSAVIAYGLLWLIAFITNIAYFWRFRATPSTLAQSHMGPWAVLVPAAGGLIIGLMARYGSDKIRGHGIPEALEAILIGRSKMDLKVAILKPLSSALSIGTGGPFGAEGPIIMTGGAAGSLVAQLFHLTSAERKTLLVAGAAGGMAAVFNTPVAAVLLAVELLLFEWKPRSLIPVACAATAAAAVRIPLLGSGAIFPVAPHASLGVEGLCFAALVGLIAGFGSGLLTTMVYALEDLFPRLKLHWMWWPVIGGLVVGLGGLVDPRVLGVGYGTIHQLLNGQVLGMAALGLVIGKALVWSVALGSGTSGGVLAPLLMMGGALGALAGQVLPVGTPGLWAMIGMAGMMSGTMRSPFTSIIFELELTYDVRMLPALLIGGIMAEAVTVLLLKRSILTEKVARRGHHLTREYSVDPFEIHRVREVMAAEEASQIPVEIAGNPVVVGEDASVREAVRLMIQHEVDHLPVVSGNDRFERVGTIDRAHLLDAQLRWYDEEHVRGKGF